VKKLQEISLISRSNFEKSAEWGVIKNKIRIAIDAIPWAVGASNFTINPTRHGNRALTNSASQTNCISFWAGTVSIA
jgi:Restriction endonuclease BamHI